MLSRGLVYSRTCVDQSHIELNVTEPSEIEGGGGERCCVPENLLESFRKTLTKVGGLKIVIKLSLGRTIKYKEKS